MENIKIEFHPEYAIESLGGSMAKFREEQSEYTSLQFTINLPRSKLFKEKTPSKQKATYLRLHKLIMRQVKKEFLCYSYHVFEFCKDGNVHMHGIIYYKSISIQIDKFDIKMRDIGFMIEYSKIISRLLKARTEPKYYDDSKRITSPLINMRFSLDQESHDNWLKYLEKSQ